MDVKTRIIADLLKGEKTTGEIARELGYVQESGIAKYNEVVPYLNSLHRKGWVERTRGKKEKAPGPNKTYWSIKPDTTVLFSIAQSIPDLIPKMQKSELGRNTILKEFDNLYGLDKKNGWIEKRKSDFLVSLECSRTFFLLHLKHNKKTMGEKILKWFGDYDISNTSPILDTHRFGKEYFPDSIIRNTFLRCVFIDFMNGYVSSAELKKLYETKKKVAAFNIKIQKEDEALKKILFLQQISQNFKPKIREKINKEIQDWEKKSSPEDSILCYHKILLFLHSTIS